MAGTSAPSDIYPAYQDPNPILDSGCPRSVGGIRSAVALALAMGLDFKLEPMDCDPFYHGYGENCSDARITIGIWRLPLVDLKGNKAENPFYVTKGSGVLLLGNSVLKNATVRGGEDLLILTPGSVPNLPTDMALPTYTTKQPEFRTHLHVVISQASEFKTYFASSKAFFSDKTKKIGTRVDHSNKVLGKTAKEFATKLHLYTHMSLRDMKAFCQRGGIMTPVLRQALEVAMNKCTSCKTTGKPLHNRKVSLNKLLRTFNEDVQVDFMWIKDLCPNPIFHMRDSATGFCVATIAPSKYMEVAARLFEMHWANVHGPPSKVSADPEFDNEEFKLAVTRNGAVYNPRPARRHNKIGAVESANFTFRVITLRLLKDAEHQRLNRGIELIAEEVLSKAVYLTNILYGQKSLSAFELAKGYTPAISGMQQTPVDLDLVDTHHEQIARRAMQKMLGSRDPHVIPKHLLPRGTPVYFFEKATNFGTHLGFVQQADNRYVSFSRTKTARGKFLKVAYEDIRLYPSSSLLHELDKIELADMSEPFKVTTPETCGIMDPADKKTTGHNRTRVKVGYVSS